MQLQKLTPYGKLYSHDREYFLVRPEPVYAEFWLTETQQAWSVVYAGTESVNVDKATHKAYYTPVRQIICSDALIELIPNMREIQVQMLDEPDETEVNMALETAERDPSEPDAEDLSAVLAEFDEEE